MARDRFYSLLTPFVSLTLGHAQSPPSNAILAQKAADSVEELLAADVKAKVVFEFEKGLKRSDAVSGAAVRSFKYKRRVTPGWTSDDQIVDIENHLVIAIALDGCVGIHFSDVHLRGSVRVNLSADLHKDLPLSWLFAVPRGIMSAAFLQDGEARTLWLAGTHRRSALKADSKILSGLDLDYALDPFEDQSFFWSAARSRNSKLETVIGVSPNSSRIWTRKAAHFDDFVAASVAVLGRLKTAKTPIETPFRYLASPLTSIKPNQIHSAFDVSIMPPDFVGESEDTEDEMLAISSLIYETNLVVDRASEKAPSFSIDALQNGQSIGTFSVGVTINSSGKVKFSVDQMKPDNSDVLKAIAAQVAAGERVNVRYNTGHSVSGGRVFALRNRRVSFNGYDGRKFTKFNILKEKPSSLDKIGTEDSLFCWVQSKFSGWLACDDGSMEKADFIHLDDKVAPNVLSLIHVKGAHSDSSNRRISVSAYEVVTGQAVKNLLWLDRDDLVSGLNMSVRKSNYFWHNHKKVSRGDFIKKLEGLPADHETRVVVVQPHVSLSILKSITPTKKVQSLQADQLNALLASAERTCAALNAKFQVICDA